MGTSFFQSRAQKLTAFAACLAALFVTPAANAETDVEFILDISGSMQQKLGGEPQIESAKKALAEAINEIQPSQLVALRVYGHRVDQTKKEESCRDTELLVPFKQLDKSEIKAKVANLTPKGYTPIAYSLEQSRNDLLDVGIGREAERVIILMTDGEETCGGDSIAVLQRLKDEGFKLKVYTVGFNVNDVARKQLQDIAQFSGGRYFDAKSSVELKRALSDAARESVVLLNKKKSTYGNEIRGGDSYETAVPLELAKEYRLDHHQKADDFDYFSIDAKRGDEITLHLATLEKGVSFLDDGTPRENTTPYAGIELHDGLRNKQKHIYIIGARAKNDTIAFRPKEDGRYYVLVGSTYDGMHKDSVSFKLTSKRNGDLNGDVDAGDSFDTALPVQPQRYPKNTIGDTDQIDMFSFEGKKGEKYTLGVIPNATESGYFAIRVVDDFKQQLYQGSSSSNAGLKSSEIEIPEDGSFFIEVKFPHDEFIEYALVIKKRDSVVAETGGEAPGGPSSQ